MKNKILILADDRPGTSSQAIGLAQKLGLEFNILTISYSFFKFIPNYIFSKSIIRLSRKAKLDVKNIQHAPNIIISAGRRSASAALYLKKKFNNTPKVIQIMNPEINFKNFDLIILPKHDNISQENHKNLITTIGSLTKISDEEISLQKEKFANLFKKLTKPKIVLLLGGPSKNRIFSESSAIKLAKIASRVTNNMDGILLTLSSRRTTKKILTNFKENLKCDNIIFDWNDYKNNNPYLAALANANYFIISGDSVSMISECCYFQKPVFIFDEKNISSKKHRMFHKELINNNYAKKLKDSADKLEDYNVKKLDETSRISKIILENYC